MGVELFKQGLELFADQWQAPGTITLKPSADLSDYLELSTTSNRTLITAISANDNPLVMGKDATTGHSLDADDVIFGEDIEVDGVAYLDSDVIISTANGTDVNPGSDIDADLITVGVNGAPILSWDETQNRFALTHGLIPTNATTDLGVTAYPWRRLNLINGITARTNVADFVIDSSVTSGSATHLVSLKMDSNAVFAIEGVGNGSGGIDTATLRALFYGEVNFGGKSPQNCDSINAMAYTQTLEILGDYSVFLPFSEATGSTVTDWTSNGHDATTSETLQTFDTPPAFVGSQYAYDLNGTDEEMDIADHADFSTAGAMSVGAWVNMTTSANSTAFGVWDANSKREWRLSFNASGSPTFEAYDEGNSASIGRKDTTDIGTGSWKFVVATFDGAGVSAGINIYINGVDLDDADVETGSGFANQVDSAAALDIGFNEDGSSAPENYFDGLMWGPWMTKKELSADEVWNLYKIGKGLLDQ